MMRKTVLVIAIAVVVLAVAGVAVAGVGFGSADTANGDGNRDSATSTTAAAHSVADDRSMDVTGVNGARVGELGDDYGASTTTTMGDDDGHDAGDDAHPPISEGTYVIDVSPAGSITVEVRDGYLYLTEIDIDPKWMPHKRDEKSDEFELGFYWGESELKIKVELEDGHLKKMIEFDIKDEDRHDGYVSTTTTTTMDDGDEGSDAPKHGVSVIDVSPAGSITVEVRDGYLYLTEIDIDPKWMPHKRDEKSDEFELGFYWGESELKIKVELEDGHLKKMIEFDIK